MTDVMSANGNASMITSLRRMNFVTVEHIPSQKSEQLSKNLNKVIKLYGRGGFVIRVILMDMEFENVAELMGKVEVNIALAR